MLQILWPLRRSPWRDRWIRPAVWFSRQLCQGSPAEPSSSRPGKRVRGKWTSIFKTTPGKKSGYEIYGHDISYRKHLPNPPKPKLHRNRTEDGFQKVESLKPCICLRLFHRWSTFTPNLFCGCWLSGAGLKRSQSEKNGFDNYKQTQKTWPEPLNINKH